MYNSFTLHDLDLRRINSMGAYTEDFHVLHTTYAYMYNTHTHTLQRHHFAQTLCILNSEGCNIFSGLESDVSHISFLLIDVFMPLTIHLTGLL